MEKKYKVKNPIQVIYKNNKIYFEGAEYKINTVEEKQELFYIIYLATQHPHNYKKEDIIKLLKWYYLTIPSSYFLFIKMEGSFDEDFELVGGSKQPK